MSRRRYILMSDLHKCHIDWYKVKTEDRHIRMLKQLNESCKDDMPDGIFILGDVSLDFWIFGEKGCYLRYPSYSYTNRFVREVVPSFPVKPYMIPGNHEQYRNDTWKFFTGYDRTYTVKLGNDVFVLLDNFSANLEPSYHSDGTYTQPNVEIIMKAVKDNPSSNIFLCAHYFDIQSFTDEFRQILNENKNIRCLFAGHTHSSKVISDASCSILQTGNYSYGHEDTPWGWRELIVEDDKITSFYHVPNNSDLSDAREISRQTYDTDGWEAEL